MKNKKNLLSVLLTAVLLCALVCGVLVFGANAAATNEVYVVDGVGGSEDAEGNPTYATIKAALKAAATQAPEWEAGSTLTVKLTADVTLKGQTGDILFEVPTIFIADDTKLPITIISAKDDETNVNLIFNSDTDNEEFCATNDYTFENLNMKFRTPTNTSRYHRFIAGSGNVVLKNCVLSDTADGNCVARFYCDVSGAGNKAVFNGWKQANVDAEIARYRNEKNQGENFIRTSINFFGTDYDHIASNNWTLQRVVARSASDAWEVEGEDVTITNEMTEARLIVEGDSSMGRLVGVPCLGNGVDNESHVLSNVNWPGKTAIEVRGGTVLGITGDSGSPAYNYNGGTKNIRLDIEVSGGTIKRPNPSSPYPYSISGTTRDPYGEDTLINIYVEDDAVLEGGVYAIGGNNNSADKNLDLAGDVNIYLNGGSIAGSVYGTTAESATHSLLPTGKIYIEYNGTDIAGGIYGWGESNATVEGDVCINLCADRTSTSMRVQALCGSSTVKAGAKAGIKSNADMTSTANIYALTASTVEEGAEVYYNLESGTVEDYINTVWNDAAASWVAEDGAVIATRFNGGIYSVDDCYVYRQDYSKTPGLSSGAIFRMEWNGTIPFDDVTSDNATKANYRYFSPIRRATIPCNVEFIVTNLNTGTMNETATESGYTVSRLERWVIGTSAAPVIISGDLTLIIDTTEDGLKLDEDGKRATDDSDVNKEGCAVAVAAFQDWGTAYVGGHSKTYVNGGESKNVTLDDFHAVSGTNITLDAKNFSTTGQVGFGRSGYQNVVTAESDYAIGNVTVVVKDATIGNGFYATNNGYVSSGEGKGSYGSTMKVYGTVSVKLDGCTIFGNTVLTTPNCTGTVNPIEVNNTNMGGAVYLYKGKATLDNSQVHIATNSSYLSGIVAVADGAELVIKENCGKFRYGVGKVPQEAYATVGGNITVHGGENYGYSTNDAAAGGIVGNKIIITGGNFERKVQGNDVTISGGNFGVSATGVAVSGAKVTLSGGTFNWASNVSGDSVILAGGTIYMTGTDAAHKIEATEITAETKIVRKSAKFSNAIVDGRDYVTLPATAANLEYLTFDDADVSGYWSKDVEGEYLILQGHRPHTYEASLVITNRVAINFIFNKAEIDHALANTAKALTYKFTTPYVDVNGTLSAENYDAEKGTYVVSLEAVGAKDFDVEYSLSGTLFTDKSFSINSIATAGAAVEGASAELVTLYKALLDYGAAAEGTLIEQTAGVEIDTTDIPADLSAEKGNGKVVFDGKNLLMGDAIGIRLYIDAANSADTNATVKLFGEDITSKCVIDTTEKYTVDIYINALRMNDKLVFTVYDNEGTLCLTLTDTVKNIANQLATAEPQNRKALSTLALIQAIQNYAATLA